ncbi:XRE family transcriptional regulator [Liquorilactobacillus uvarum]|uniref:XRE family transcriptional regulator n=1 Tax=Liquorilactobacillus uvarum TaxID=303240 RepID=UPI00288B14AD|nr:XRE family transcriptional regulator [Liquorilactobacillus uvarum]
MTRELEELVIIGLKRNKRLGLKPSSQTDVARHFGLSNPYVNRLITGKAADTENTKKRINEICGYIGVTEKWYLQQKGV